MPVDPELLELLVCPRSKGALRPVPLPAEVCGRLVDRYREHFGDEEPEVTEGLWCRDSGLVYPVVSDVPVMLAAEALPAAEVVPEAAEEGDRAPGA